MDSTNCEHNNYVLGRGDDGDGEVGMAGMGMEMGNSVIHIGYAMTDFRPSAVLITGGVGFM